MSQEIKWIISVLCCSLFFLTASVRAAPQGATPLPIRKGEPSPTKTSGTELRAKAEQELSLLPLQSRIRSKSSQVPPMQVENLPIPEPLVRPTHTEAAITLSALSPKGTSKVLADQNFDLSTVEQIPIIAGQIQHWTYKDFERGQNIGFIFGTALGEKQVNVTFNNGYTLDNVEILYLKLQSGLSWEQALWQDRFSVGISGLITEELWQQNTPSLESRWSRWSPSLALVAQVKGQLNQRWYSMLEIHNHWPLRENQVEASQQRAHLGVGYYL